MPFYFFFTPDLIRIFMTASSKTARLLSLVVLILSLAPLGSLYVLMLSLTSTPFYSSNSLQEMESSLAQVLQNPNVTIEELFQAVFVDQWSPYQSPLTALLPLREHNLGHFRLLVPWLVSFILGVVVPCILALYSFLRGRRLRRERSQRKERRRTQVTAKLTKFTKVLTQEDEINDSLDQETASWRIPAPGLPKGDDDKGQSRAVVGTCAVCLHVYQVGDEVAWAPNPQCRHCFHRDCIASWLGKRTNLCQLCPCCRQCFVEEESKPLSTKTPVST